MQGLRLRGRAVGGPGHEQEPLRAARGPLLGRQLVLVRPQLEGLGEQIGVQGARAVLGPVTGMTDEQLMGIHRSTVSSPQRRPLCHTHGMSRTRLSTTVDADLLAGARSAVPGATDAKMLDEALSALIARHRAAEIEAGYVAYDEHPLDEPDAWGDLASFREAAGRS